MVQGKPIVYLMNKLAKTQIIIDPKRLRPIGEVVKGLEKKADKK
jgi:hypothetical protein